VINLNALLRRRVEYYEYPSALEARVHATQSYFRSLFQAQDVGFIFGKSMPRSGHRFLADCLQTYFGPALHYCGFYDKNSGCCARIPCKRPRNAERSNRYFLQKSHDFGFRDTPLLNGKYLIQYRSPVPRLQSNFELHMRDTGDRSGDTFTAFAESETAYFINFYRKWIAVSRPDTYVVAYEDLIYHQQQTLAGVIRFVQSDPAIDPAAMERTLAAHTVRGGDDEAFWGLRDPKDYPFGDAELFARLERQVADACGTDRIVFHYI
jgi:hypothetical protein